MLGVDLDKPAFDAKVREFSSSLADADTAVLFYAGHGLQIAGSNYLVPVVAEDSPLAPELIAWTRDRFAGKPNEGNCKPRFP